MTYFNLRKRASEPEPEDDVEFVEEQAEDESVEDAPAGGWPAALRAGFTGPGRWIAERFGTGWALTAYVGSMWAFGFYGGWTAAGIALVWLLAFLAFVPREHKDRITAALEHRSPQASDDSPEATDEVPVSPLVTLIWKLIGEAPGVHVKTLAELIGEAAPQEGSDRAAVRAAVRAELGALGIPLRASVRDASGRVNEGVHRADLVAWLKDLPSTAPAAPPETRSGPVATAVTCDVADAPTPVATPRSPLRRLLSRGGA